MLDSTQFLYSPLVWMCCDKTSDNRINHLHERALRLFTMTMCQHLKNF